MWTGGNRSLGLFQPVANGDLQVETKFDTLPSAPYQSEGILAEQDSNTRVRMDVFFDGSTLRVFAATFTGGVPTAVANVPITDSASSIWLRMQRIGNTWTESWSSDGTNFSVAATFNFTLTLAQIGPFSGNAGRGSSPPPAWTVKEDYFRNTTPTSTGAPPVISVWYGQNQTFGAIGRPQQWVNILGNVSDPVGVASLSYTVNGGPSQPMSIGPNLVRLVSPGDFNAEIDYASLNPGVNTVIVTAVDAQGRSASSSVTVNYVSGTSWPVNYSVNWSQASGGINSVAQIVDGRWAVQPDGMVRTVDPGYDRLIAIGDAATWKDYDVLVPVKINSMPSNGAGIGVVVGWKGHTTDQYGVNLSDQPRTGHPFPALAWFNGTSSSSMSLQIYANDNTAFDYETVLSAIGSPQLTVGVTYMYRVDVQQSSSTTSLVSFKVWQQGAPEPSSWTLQATSQLSQGSILLASYMADASFGNVSVTALP